MADKPETMQEMRQRLADEATAVERKRPAAVAPVPAIEPKPGETIKQYRARLKKATKAAK